MDQVLAELRPDIRLLASRFADAERRVGSTSDLLQDACLRAWLKLDSFEGGKDDEETFWMFQSWIAMLVRRLGINAARDRNRKRRRPGEGKKHVPIGTVEPDSPRGKGKPVDPLSTDPTPSAYAINGEARHRVRDALNRLDDQVGAEIVRRRFYEGEKIREIARDLSLDYDQAYTRYRKALKDLGEDLGDLR